MAADETGIQASVSEFVAEAFERIWQQFAEERPRTLCRPMGRVIEVSRHGHAVRLTLTGPRRAVRAHGETTPEVARWLAGELLRTAEEIDGQGEAVAAWASCAPYDVPGLFADGAQL